MKGVGLHFEQPKQFRPLKEGPEAKLQYAVQDRLNALFPQCVYQSWTASSVPVGAGMPDILRATCKPEVVALGNTDHTSQAVIAYLRGINRARPQTISTKLGKNIRAIEQRLSHLVDAEIVVSSGGCYSLAINWKCVLPEVLTIEVKVADWRRAMSQAARNRIFSHRSFVALPSMIAERVQSERSFFDSGIGLLAIDYDGEVRILRKARKSAPRVWTYYYSLAYLAANHLSGEKCAVRAEYRDCPDTIS